MSVSESAALKPDTVAETELSNELGNLREENEKLKQDLATERENYSALLKVNKRVTDDLEQELAEARADYAKLLESSSRVKANLEKEVGELREQLEKEGAHLTEVKAELSNLRAQLGTLAADREELAQFKKQAAGAAEELHREMRLIELEKVSGQQELTDARAELADAQATILKQSDKIWELEREYNLKLNPAESTLRKEDGNLQAELEAERQQQAAVEFELPDAADVLNRFKAKRKKSKIDLADIKAIFELIEN